MFRFVNLQPIAYVSPVEMAESIVLRMSPNDKSLTTLGKLIFQAIAWNVLQERNLCIFCGKNMEWRSVAFCIQN